MSNTSNEPLYRHLSFFFRCWVSCWRLHDLFDPHSVIFCDIPQACALPVALDTGFKLSSPLLCKRVHLILASRSTDKGKEGLPVVYFAQGDHLPLINNNNNKFIKNSLAVKLNYRVKITILIAYILRYNVQLKVN